eukprot:5852125-Pleurochrysis_carterae.AAC.1
MSMSLGSTTSQQFLQAITPAVNQTRKELSSQTAPLSCTYQFALSGRRLSEGQTLPLQVFATTSFKLAANITEAITGFGSATPKKRLDTLLSEILDISVPNASVTSASRKAVAVVTFQSLAADLGRIESLSQEAGLGAALRLGLESSPNALVTEKVDIFFPPSNPTPLPSALFAPPSPSVPQLSPGAIAAIAISNVLFVLLLAFLCLVLFMKCKQKRKYRVAPRLVSGITWRRVTAEAAPQQRIRR